MIALVSVLTVVWLGWTWWTVRRLWRPAETPYERMVYQFGVRGWGVWMFVAMSATSLVRDHDPTWSVGRSALQILFVVVTAAPLMLWGGYWWGRGMAFFFGLDPSRTSTSNERS